MAGSSQSSVLAVIRHPFVWTFTWLYMILQAVLTRIFSPVPPPPTANDSKDIPRKRVAVIGAGLTGVSSAAHCVGHGFDVQIFESRPKDKGLGGIWSVSDPSDPRHAPKHQELCADSVIEGQFHLRPPGT